jgi:hypothetical protein
MDNLDWPAEIMAGAAAKTVSDFIPNFLMISDLIQKLEGGKPCTQSTI